MMCKGQSLVFKEGNNLKKINGAKSAAVSSYVSDIAVYIAIYIALANLRPTF